MVGAPSLRGELLSKFAVGDKQQAMYQFPDGRDYHAELVAAVAGVCGVEPAALVLSERHIKAYEATAVPDPPAHKDRFASEFAVGFSVRVPEGSTLVLYPRDERAVNPFNSSTELRASLRPDALPEKTLAGVVPGAATLRELSDEEIIARLTQVRGIGRWTVEMLLVFQLGRPDVLPVDDFGVRTGFQAAYGLSRLPRPQALAAWGERWKPYRTTAACYLWRANELKRAGTLPAPAERIRLPRIRRARRRVGRKVAAKARASALKAAGTSSAPLRRSGARTRSRPRRARRSPAPGSRK